MNLDEARTLLAWARMQLEIVTLQNPTAMLDITPETVQRSAGYRKLRAWYVRLSPGKRARAEQWMRANIEAVREMIAKSRATGEPLSMADVTIEVIDAKTGEPLEPPDLQPTACRGSGAGLPAMTRIGELDYITCPGCIMRWEVHTIGFRIPDHEPVV